MKSVKGAVVMGSEATTREQGERGYRLHSGGTGRREANAIWSKAVRRREEKEKTIQDFIKEHETWKETHQRSVKDAQEKAKASIE
ncbi:hypothetical protein Dimus_036423 [Dionaea muscipula]